jgi:hypothetical protein
MIGLDDLSEPQRAVLDAIVRGGDDPKRPMACVETFWLVSAGHNQLVLDELVNLGLAAEWMLAGVLQYTLTPYAAWLLKVHILERTTIVGEELSEDPYWAETSQEPRSIHLPKRRHEIRWPWMDELPDPKSLRKSGEVMRDEDGEPVKVLGMEVPVDRRLKGGAKQAKARRRAG